MRPLPKWLAWIGNIAAVGSAVGGFAGLIPGKTGLIIAAVAAISNSISHSLPGTGGTPTNP